MLTPIESVGAANCGTRHPGLPLDLTEKRVLQKAAGTLIEPSACDYAVHRDLEIRGYLRRIISFNPTHYGRGDRAPKYAWTRTELAELILGRSESTF